MISSISASKSLKESSKEVPSSCFLRYSVIRVRVSQVKRSSFIEPIHRISSFLINQFSLAIFIKKKAGSHHIYLKKKKTIFGKLKGAFWRWNDCILLMYIFLRQKLSCCPVCLLFIWSVKNFVLGVDEGVFKTFKKYSIKLLFLQFTTDILCKFVELIQHNLVLSNTKRRDKMTKSMYEVSTSNHITRVTEASRLSKHPHELRSKIGALAMLH
ncbi:hypothetical protein BD560DRAFT_419712 [Blakeslea trispora]|nr:hypothetical protein BD560DRAFT_419712 [Blakeslea trispora]